jgi:hypothetical protein
VKPVNDPRRLHGAPFEDQRAFLVDAVLANRLAGQVLQRARRLNLPDHALMAGAVYQAVWNALTGRDPAYGVNDYDLAYFDASDLSAEAEQAVIDRSAAAFARLDADVELCNQARVHIWFSKKYDIERAPLIDTEDAVRHFASKTHAAALRYNENSEIELLAPFGLDELFSLAVKPLPNLAGADSWNAKCAKQKVLWPEIDFQTIDV